MLAINLGWVAASGDIVKKHGCLTFWGRRSTISVPKQFRSRAFDAIPDVDKQTTIQSKKLALPALLDVVRLCLAWADSRSA
jgi:hypothetical protein